MTEERKRLDDARGGATRWRLWGPYLAERAWGTVREDYSADGDAWRYFPHDQARSRAYRWNEDGLLGICDESQRLCFALALWNGADAMLKERPFGLTGHEGNHGEDVKEYWFYVDNVPSHAYMRALYKYPQRAFPYEQLVAENTRRGRNDPEFELLDTGVFADDRYFDVTVEYAKGGPTDILVRITVANRGPDDADVDVLPTLWFRNCWSWGIHAYRPSLSAWSTRDGSAQILAEHESLGRYHLSCDGEPELLFTENETNVERLFDSPNRTPYVKDAFHEYVVGGRAEAVNPQREGTKAAARYRLTVPSGGERVVRLRLSTEVNGAGAFGAAFDTLFARRVAEADAFYEPLAAAEVSDDERLVQRQAFAGLLWSKQFYSYDVQRWLIGDPAEPKPPLDRWEGRNHGWLHLNNHDIVSMPDTWEYPWYAAWDLAFHTVPLAMVDPDFAKEQLVLLLREWFMHPNGQLPAYEWAFGDVNPPVHAWAAMRVYQIERKATGVGDVRFLERVFHKLLINFTWWVNRKDADGRNVFQGGFLGLDNIGVFNRSEPLPDGARLDQSDGTSWMATFCLNMLAIALELARGDNAYEDVATKFLEHFFHIAHAMNDRAAALGDPGVDLWANDDEFYYDLISFPNGDRTYVRVRSMVGLIPLLAVQTMDAELLAKLPDFRSRLEWFLHNRGDMVGDAASVIESGEANRRLFAIVSAPRLRAILRRMLDEEEFLSPYGLRALSRWHAQHPFRLCVNGQEMGEADYEPAESRSGLFGGNSNWRGPVWMPLNYLIIEALQKFDWYYGPTFTVEYPTGSGQMLTLWEVSVELSRRLIRLFVRHEGRRAVFGGTELFQRDPHWRDLVPFHEYFHGDNGAGLGASHQTGWTSLVAKLIQQSGVPSVK
jgi:Mannosylglycerate hydrolase MGH1-like glycoside hydrolase domain/Glycosyl hydrolase family 63 C-terminal domain